MAESEEAKPTDESVISAMAESEEPKPNSVSVASAGAGLEKSKLTGVRVTTAVVGFEQSKSTCVSVNSAMVWPPFAIGASEVVITTKLSGSVDFMDLTTDRGFCEVSDVASAES